MIRDLNVDQREFLELISRATEVMALERKVDLQDYDKGSSFHNVVTAIAKELVAMENPIEYESNN